MYPIKKMIVCLDQSPLDQTLIAFAGAIAKVNQVKKIYFTNVIKNFGLPKEMLEEFPDLIEKMVGERRTAMENTVHKYLDPQKGLEVSFVVKEGNLSKKILKLAEETDNFNGSSLVKGDCIHYVSGNFSSSSRGLSKGMGG